MTEENEYYTPEISEFHAGFEFEIKISNDTWVPQIYGADFINGTDDNFETNQQRFLYGITNNTIRVKRLDQEDLKSLEWSVLGSETHFMHKNQKHVLVIFPNDKIEIRHLGSQSYTEATFFLGHIKNKSELKALMRQLQIQ